MTYEATVRYNGAEYSARIGGCTASATSSAARAVERAARKSLGETAKFTVKRKGGPATIVEKTWREIWLVIEEKNN